MWTETPSMRTADIFSFMEGRWSRLAEIGDETTYGSQPSFLLQKDGRVLYFGDRWGGDGEKYFTSSYVIYPLEEHEGKLVLRPVDEITL